MAKPRTATIFTSPQDAALAGPLHEAVRGFTELVAEGRSEPGRPQGGPERARETVHDITASGERGNNDAAGPCSSQAATGYAVPPTVRPSMRNVGCPTPTGTLCPSLPQVP